MMKKQPTATQQKLIDSGAAARTLTIRYETSRYGSAARRETVKATMPDLGDGHAVFQAGRDTYMIANNAIYRAQTHNLNESHWGRQPGELHETFYMGTYQGKADAVSEAYDNTYSDSVVVNGRVALPVNKVLYAHLLDGRMYVVDGLDTVGDYSGSEYVCVNSQKIGSWRVPLIHAAKLRDAYRQRMNSYGIDGDLHDDETFRLLMKPWRRRSQQTRKAHSGALTLACTCPPRRKWMRRTLSTERSGALRTATVR